MRLMTTAALGLAAAATAVPAFAQELTFWSWRQEDKAVYEELIGKFEAENPGITVKFEPFEATQYNTILATALAGDEGPDIMQVRAYGGFESVAEAGYLMPLSGEIDGLDAMPEGNLAAETLRSDGKIYAVPFATQSVLVIYNKGMFDEMGLSVPQTMDELLALCDKVEANGTYCFGNGTATAWQNETIVSALGASIAGRSFYDDLMAGNTDFTDERFVEALKALKTYSEHFPDGFTGLDYPSAQQIFSSELSAMFAGGSFQLSAFQAQNPDLDLGVFAAPGKSADDEKLVATWNDGGYAGNAKTEHPEAVKKFLTFLASPEFAQDFANKLGNVSPVPGVSFENPLLKDVAKLDEQSVPYIMLTNFRWEEPTGSTLLQTEVQKMLAGEATPEEAAKAVNDGLAAWYEPFQK